MCHPVVVRILQGIGNLHNNLHKLREVIALAEVENLAQCVAVHELHRKVGIAARVSGELVGWHRIRVLKHRCHSRLADQTLLLDLVIRKLRFQRLVADEARQVQVFARLYKGLTARCDGAEKGIARARIDFLRQRLIGLFEENRGVALGRLWKIQHGSMTL